MAVFIGRRGWLGIAIEDTPGSPKPPADYLPFLECSLVGRHEIVAEETARGIRDAEGESSQLSKKWGEGTIRMVLDPTLAPYLIGLALGDFGTPSSEGDGVYTHTFSRLSSNTPKTASVTFDRVVDRNIFTCLVVNSMELSFSDGVAELSADCLSRYPVTTSSGTLATTSGTIFTFKDAQVRLADDLTAAENATPIKVREFSLSINNNAEAIHLSGNEDVEKIAIKDFRVEGSLSLLFEDTTQRDNFRDFAKKAMIVTFTGNEIGNGMNEFVKFRIAKIRFVNFEPSLPLDDVAEQGIDFVAEYSSTDAKTIDVVVRNRKASY